MADFDDYDVQFPTTLYDRPTLAMSNLLLRGDIDAATRSIFSPETLSPRELQTMRTQIAGKNPHPLVKTILDVATNPLVIAGLIGGYLIYPTASPAALLEMYQGLRKAPPIGAIGRFVTGAFARLRQYPGLHDSIMGLQRDEWRFVAQHGDAFREAYGKLPGVGKGGYEGRLINLRMRGFGKPDAGFQKVLGKYGASNDPLLDRAANFLSREYQGAEAKTRNVANALYAEFRASKAWPELEADARARGMSVGEYLKDYVPTHVKVNRWRRRYGGQFEIARPSADPMAKNLLVNKWETMPDPDELRLLEGKGVRVGAADDMLAAAERRVGVFEQRLAAAVNTAMRGPDGNKRLARYLAQGLLKSTDDAEELARVVSQNVWTAGQTGGNVAEAIKEMAYLVKYPGTYSLDFAPTWERYLARMAPTYSWHIKGHGAAITGLIEKYKGLGMRQVDQQYLEQDLLPYMTGKKTPTRFAQAVNMREWGFRRSEWLRTHPIAQQLVPEKTRSWLIKRLEDTAFGDIDSYGHGINHYLYLSTMGANLGPPSKNILQNVVTFMTMPGMGMTGLAKGGAEVFKRAGPYLDDAAKVGAEEAFRTHFPEFVDMMGPSLDVAKMFAAEPAGETTLLTAGKSLVQRAEALAMAPFKTTEMANRLTAFYGARAQALTWPGVEGVAQANKIAANVVDIAHFTGDPTGIPAGTFNWWAPFRQFTQFPLRYAGFLGESVRWGENASSFNPGTIFRGLAASAGAYTVARDVLGTDISQGLMMGALPLPQYENAPFFPAPFVPPLMQMAGNVAQAVVTGETRPLADTAPLLVPGGLAARRLGATLGPKRADYEHPLPDGRVPVYNEQGGLIGAYTPLQLGLRAMGIMPTDVAAERGAAQWLVKQRDQIRSYRQKWLDAHLANDPVAAEQVQAAFQKQYPELGPLQFKKSDINAIEQRRQVGRVNRIIRGFPAAYKPLFQNMVNEANLGLAAENIGQTYNLPPALAAMQ